MTAHADVLEIIDYAAGTLPARRAQQLQRHCSECAECGDRLAAVLLLQQARAAERPRRGATRAGVIAAAAAILAALALGLWVLRPATGIVTPQPDGLAAAAGIANDLDYLQEPLGWLLWTVEMQVGAATPAAAGAPLHGTLADVVSLLRAGEYGLAATDVADADGTGIAPLLVGIARVHAGDAAGARPALTAAMEAFGEASENSTMQHAARLYLAEAEWQCGEAEVARRHLETLVEQASDRDAFQDAAAARLLALDRGVER